MLTKYLLAFPLLAVTMSFAQTTPTPGAGAGAGGAVGAGGAGAGAAGAAGGGSPTLESEIMAYAALDRIATKVSESINPHVSTANPVLIGTQTNMSQIGAFLTFVNGTKTLVAAYNSKIPPPPTPAGSLQERSLTDAFGAGNLGPSVTAVTALLSALKAQTTTTNSTFSTTDQAFIADIESHVGDKARVVSIAFPSDLDSGSGAIATYLGDVYKARSAAVQYLVTKNAPKNKDDKPYNPSTDLKDLDTQLTALQASLAPSSGSSTSDVVLGGGLMAALKVITKNEQKEYRLADPPSYLVLTFYSDAAGGGTRINQPFLISFFFPWPYPSYNGGAVVSFSLRNQDGTFMAANTFYDLGGYSKWKAPRSGKCGYSNLGDPNQKDCQAKQSKKVVGAGGS